MVLSLRSLKASVCALVLASVACSTASASGYGNMGVCYDPFHLDSYPLNGGDMDVEAFTAAVEADFEVMAKYFTNVRTYYSTYYSVEIAPIAAKYGLKLDLGVYTTTDSWMDDQIAAAVNAIQNYPDAIDTVLVGNENMYLGWTAAQIMSFVTDIKDAGCDDDYCHGIKFGTVQRMTEYVSSSYSSQIATLKENLDILGVNLYPNMVDSYSGSKPTAILDTQWEQVTTAVGDASKVRLTEVGFPTAGDDVPSTSADSAATLAHAVNYYKAIVDWTPPTGNATFPKFWFAMHDRREDDKTQTAEYEHYFGFWTHDGAQKIENYPYLMSYTNSSTSSSSSTSTTSATSASSTATPSSSTTTSSSSTTSSSTTTSSTSSTNTSSESNGVANTSAASTSASTSNGSTTGTTEGSNGNAAVSVGTPTSVGSSTGNTTTTTATGSVNSDSVEGNSTGSTTTTATTGSMNTTTTTSTGSVNTTTGSGKKLCPDTA